MKTIELLLLENVSNIGIIGDVVKVKPGYARNYLLPHGLAIAPTPGAVSALAEKRAAVAAQMKKLTEEQTALIERINDYELTIERTANEQGVLFAAVSTKEIAEALREAGFAIQDEFVRLGEQVKRLDSYVVTIVINKDLKTRISLSVVSDAPQQPQDQDTPEDGDQQEAQVAAA